jgi:hypothetical protein
MGRTLAWPQSRGFALSPLHYSRLKRTNTKMREREEEEEEEGEEKRKDMYSKYIHLHLSSSSSSSSLQRRVVSFLLSVTLLHPHPP